MTRAAWLVALLLAVALAGCSGDPPEKSQETEEVPEEKDVPPELQYEPGYVKAGAGYVNGTDSSFICAKAAGSVVDVDANKSFAGQAHVHDQWNGEESKVIFEGTVEDFVESLQGGEIDSGKAGTWFATPGAVVYPGAGSATFKLEWDTPGTYRELGVQHGNLTTRDPRDTGVNHFLMFTESGQEHTIEFTLDENDPPHAERTHWKFKINHANAATNAGGYGVAQDMAYQTAFAAERETKFTWTIHREFDCLPIDPPHYEFWNGTDELPVFEATTEHDWRNLVGPQTGYFYGWHNGNGGIPDNGTVPPGTSQVIVEITWNPESDATARPGLEYTTAAKPSTSLETVWTRPEPAEEDGDTRVYVIDVHPTETDDPYAERSDWDFRFFMEDEATGTEDPPAGIMHGTVDWTVTAQRG